MSKRKKIELVVALPLLVLGGLGLTSNIPGPGYLKGKQMLNSLPTSVPLGTHQTAVAAYLKANNIVHSPYEVDGFPPGRYIRAIVRDYKYGFVFQGVVTTKFTFDSHDNLVDCDVEVVFTGP